MGNLNLDGLLKAETNDLAETIFGSCQETGATAQDKALEQARDYIKNAFRAACLEHTVPAWVRQRLLREVMEKVEVLGIISLVSLEIILGIAKVVEKPITGNLVFMNSISMICLGRLGIRFLDLFKNTNVYPQQFDQHLKIIPDAPDAPLPYEMALKQIKSYKAKLAEHAQG